MFDILTPDRFVTALWKNGGGVTHEIARAGDRERWRWRLSVAEVARDGPFSRFEGCSRVLTVIDGVGMDLLTPVGVLRALPLRPVSFSGETPVEGRLIAGPVRDLNVIFDPGLVRASVERLDGPGEVAAPALTGFLTLRGEADANGQAVPAGACVLGRNFRLRLGAGSGGLVVRLDEVTATGAGR